MLCDRKHGQFVFLICTESSARTRHCGACVPSGLTNSGGGSRLRAEGEVEIVQCGSSLHQSSVLIRRVNSTADQSSALIDHSIMLPHTSSLPLSQLNNVVFRHTRFTFHSLQSENI